MTKGKGLGSPIPVNRAPLGARDMVKATARGIFAVSPPGTGERASGQEETDGGGGVAEYNEGRPFLFWGARICFGLCRLLSFRVCLLMACRCLLASHVYKKANGITSHLSEAEPSL